MCPQVSTFLRAQAPEVVCLQELVSDDIDAAVRGSSATRTTSTSPCAASRSRPGRAPSASASCRGIRFVSTADICYGGGGGGMDVLDRSSEEARFATNRYSVALADITIGAETFTIGTTHFPWTDAARTADFQRSACDNLLRALKDRSLVLCGDFNAPRGMEIFTRLAAQWTDNIPPTYATSVDPVLHRAGPLQLMVDGVFSTDDYSVSDVTLHQGVSDHCAITARVGEGVSPVTRHPGSTAQGLPRCADRSNTVVSLSNHGWSALSCFDPRNKSEGRQAQREDDICGTRRLLMRGLLLRSDLRRSRPTRRHCRQHLLDQLAGLGQHLLAASPYRAQHELRDAGGDVLARCARRSRRHRRRRNSRWHRCRCASL